MNKKILRLMLLLSSLVFSETVYNQNMNLEEQLEKIRKMKATNADGAAEFEIEKQKLNGEIEVAKLQADRDIQYGTSSRLDMLDNELSVAIASLRYQNELSIPIKGISSLGSTKSIYVDGTEFSDAVSQLVSRKNNLQILQKNLNLVRNLKKTANVGIIKKYIDKIELETTTATQQAQNTINIPNSGNLGINGISGTATTTTTTANKAGNVKINTNQKIYGFITAKIIGSRVYLRAN